MIIFIALYTFIFHIKFLGNYYSNMRNKLKLAQIIDTVIQFMKLFELIG